MSGFVYGALTRQGKEAPLGQSDEAWSPGLNHYVDMYASLVPAEVLAAHTLFMQRFTETADNPAPEQVMPLTIHTDAADLLKVAFIVLIVARFVLYLVVINGTFE